MTYYLAILVHNQQLICLFLPFMSFLSIVWSVFEALRRTRITVNSGESFCSRKHNNMFDSFKEWFNILEIHFFFLSHVEMWRLFVILRGSVGPVYLTTVYWSGYDAGCRIVTTRFVFGLCKDTMVKKIYSCGDKTPQPPRNSFYISVDVWITQTKMQDIKPASFMLSYWMRLTLL